MKQLCSCILLLGTLLISACSSNPNNSSSAVDSTSTMATDSVTEVSYDISLLDNKKDPTCGMPTSAGVSDTAHYNGKVIGFCAKECKDEFLKNPKANIAAAELK